MMSSYLTKDFWLVSVGNFFLFLSFYALMPLLPFYLVDEFAAGGPVIGLILGIYMVAVIAVRPIAGYLLDAFHRKPVYLLAYTLFSLVFCMYPVAHTLLLFVWIRVLHGAAFGVSTVCGSTLVSQIVPRNHLGEGLGVYGLANTLSMCLGPMLSVFARARYSYNEIFMVLVLVAAAGVAVASMVRMPLRTVRATRRLSMDALVLRNGWWMSLTQCLIYVAYGSAMSYMAVYARELDLERYGGLYFTFMAIGLGCARPLSGRIADRTPTSALSLTLCGLLLGVFTFALLGMLPLLGGGVVAFLAVALMQGVTYGVLHPTFNALFVRLAPDTRRGAANSMCQTSNDVGNGIGMFIGSAVASCIGGYYALYLLGALLALSSVLVFMCKARHSFLRL